MVIPARKPTFGRLCELKRREKGFRSQMAWTEYVSKRYGRELEEKRVGWSQSTWSRIEKDQIVNIPHTVMKIIEKELDIQEVDYAKPEKGSEMKTIPLQKIHQETQPFKESNDPVYMVPKEWLDKYDWLEPLLVSIKRGKDSIVKMIIRDLYVRMGQENKERPLLKSNSDSD
jgi:hypothetical protein